MSERIRSTVEFALMDDGSVVVHQQSEMGCDYIAVATLADFQHLIRSMQDFHDRVLAALPDGFHVGEARQ